MNCQKSGCKFYFQGETLATLIHRVTKFEKLTIIMLITFRISDLSHLDYHNIAI